MCTFILSLRRLTKISPQSSLPPATKLGQGYVFTGMCDSVHRGGGVCLSACWDTTPPAEQTPPSRHPPGSRHPPRSRHPQSRHPLEQTLPQSRHPPRADIPPGVDTPRKQTPPSEQTPPGADTPSEQTPPRADPPQQSMLGDTVNEWAVRILLECNLVILNNFLPLIATNTFGP